MTWQILLLAYFVFGTAGYLLRRKLSQTHAKYNRLINGFFFLGVHYPLGLMVAYISNPNLSIGLVNGMFLLFGSAVFPLINILAFRASKTVDAGLFTIIHNLAPIITIVTASLLLQERLNDQQLLGAAVILTSAFLATLPRLRRRSTSSSSGMMFALASVTLLGVAIVYERWMLTRIDFGAYLVFGWGAQTLWAIAAALPESKYLYILKDKKSYVTILGYSIAKSLAGLFFVGALKLSGNASVVGGSASFMSVLVVLAAYFVLREKEWLWLKVGAAVIGAVGLLIISIAN